MRSEVLTMGSMLIAIDWDVTLYSLAQMIQMSLLSVAA
jgi:hypothetical protein